MANNNKDSPPGTPPGTPKNNNTNTTEAEDLIKSNKSTMQQLLAALDENQRLKEDLVDREARLALLTKSVNDVLSNANADAAALHKQLTKDLVMMADLIAGVIQPQLQAANVAISQNRLSAQEKMKWSVHFRQTEGLNPLDMTPQTTTK